MRKFGTLSLTVYEKGKPLQVVHMSKDPTYDRIDVLEDLSLYSLVDTTNCLASYYRKGREHAYGNDEIIKTMFRIKNQASSFKGQQNQSIDVTAGKTYMNIIKEDESIGMKYFVTLCNGKLFREEYVTPDGALVYDTIDYEDALDMLPINSYMYAEYSLLVGKQQTEGGTTEYFDLDYLRSRYPIAHLDDMDYVVVSSYEEAEERLQRFIESPEKIKAIDIETTGVDLSIFGVDQITGVVMSWGEEDSTYYPFRQDVFTYNLPLSFLDKICSAVNDQPRDVTIVAHNGKFEINGFFHEGKHIRIDADSFLLSTLIVPVMRTGLHALKNLAYRATNKFFLDLKHIFKGKIMFNVLPEEIVKYYACADTTNAIIVYKWLLKQLPVDEKAVFALENKLMYVKACNEYYGMRTDKKLLAENMANEEYKVQMLGDMFRSIHKTDKNINSPDVRRDIFYNKLRCPIEVRTKTGKPSTSAIAVERIVELGTLKNYDHSNVPKAIKDLRKASIIKGEDLVSNKYPSLVILDKYNKSTKELGALKRIERKSIRGRVMFNINQTGAGSGRQTSDAHQYSDVMKSIILSDSPEHYLVSCDYKQIELRVLAFLADQPDLKELMKDPTVDIHRAILSIILGMEMWEISKKQRNKGKQVNFGVVYMMSEYGLAKKEHGPAFTNEDLLEASKSINDFYNGLPKIKAFVKGNEEFVKKHGYIKTAFNSYRYFKEILDPETPKDRISSMVRAANNTPVQGFAAYLMKMAEVNLFEYIKSKKWDETVVVDGAQLPLVRLMLSIHDEVLCSFHRSIPLEEIVIMFKECMEIVIKNAPPFFAAPAIVERWSEGKLDQAEIPITLRDEMISVWKKEKRSIVHLESYLDDLNNYRTHTLVKYMDALIEEYREPDVVATHVKHPDLTHVLIATFILKDEKFEHKASIRIATERYMQAKEDGTLYSNTQSRVAPSVLAENEDTLSGYDELLEHIEFGEDGEVILDDSVDLEEDDILFRYDNTPKQVKQEDKEYCVYAMDEVLIDITDLSLESAEIVNINLAKFSNPKEYYNVTYVLKNKMLKSCMKVGHIPGIINTIVRDVIKEKMEVPM